VSQIAKNLLKGAQEALGYSQGDKVSARRHLIQIPATIDIQAVSQRLNLTRAEFARRYLIDFK